MKYSFDSQFNSLPNESETSVGTTLGGVSMRTRAGVVNRTHRVVRERAKGMQARRSYVRSLMIPSIVCSVLLLLTGFAIWTGLDQYQAAEAVQANVAASVTTDSNNHFLVVMLWFVPVSVALLAVFLSRRMRNGSDREPLR
jgi:hypothetical protein